MHTLGKPSSPSLPSVVALGAMGRWLDCRGLLGSCRAPLPPRNEICGQRTTVAATQAQRMLAASCRVRSPQWLNAVEPRQPEALRVWAWGRSPEGRLTATGACLHRMSWASEGRAPSPADSLVSSALPARAPLLPKAGGLQGGGPTREEPQPPRLQGLQGGVDGGGTAPTDHLPPTQLLPKGRGCALPIPATSGWSPVTPGRDTLRRGSQPLPMTSQPVPLALLPQAVAPLPGGLPVDPSLGNPGGSSTRGQWG